MNYIDTHSHLYQSDYQTDIDEVIVNAKQNGISQIYTPNVDIETIQPMLSLAAKYPDYIIPLMGLHPTSINENYVSQLKIIENEIQKRNYAGIGEIGIDLYWDSTFKKEQQDAFKIQIQWAIDLKIPIIIHVRNSFRETMEIINQFNTNDLSGIFHSFGGTVEEANEILSLKNFYMGINGIVTFKNTDLTNTLTHIPIERIVLETDSPYLTPVPNRGKRNHPSYIKIIAEKLSEIYNLPLEKIGEITNRNVSNIFKNAVR